MGNYYFTFLFSPIYSVIFAIVCRSYGNQAINQKNSYYKFMYFYLSFICALGIGMYNIEIALGNIVQVIFPIYVIIRFSYGKENKEYEYI